MQHRCRWIGCDRIIPDSLFMCHLHWYRIPLYLREQLWAAWRQGVLSPQYELAHREIQTWIREHQLENA